MIIFENKSEENDEQKNRSKRIIMVLKFGLIQKVNLIKRQFRKSCTWNPIRSAPSTPSSISLRTLNNHTKLVYAVVLSHSIIVNTYQVNI